MSYGVAFDAQGCAVGVDERSPQEAYPSGPHFAHHRTSAYFGQVS